MHQEANAPAERELRLQNRWRRDNSRRGGRGWRREAQLGPTLIEVQARGDDRLDSASILLPLRKQSDRRMQGERFAGWRPRSLNNQTAPMHVFDGAHGGPIGQSRRS